MQLNSDVLPAPLGPITENSSPGRTSKLTSRSAVTPANRSVTPSSDGPAILLVHGDMDNVVDPQHSADADAALRQAGYGVSYHVSPGVAHGIAPDGLAFASDFIARISAK